MEWYLVLSYVWEIGFLMAFSGFFSWQSRLALKPDGLFLAAIFGGETLRFVVFLLVWIFSSLLKIPAHTCNQGTENCMYSCTHGAWRRHQSTSITIGTSMFTANFPSFYCCKKLKTPFFSQIILSGVFLAYNFYHCWTFLRIIFTRLLLLLWIESRVIYFYI